MWQNSIEIVIDNLLQQSTIELMLAVGIHRRTRPGVQQCQAQGQVFCP